MAVHDPWPGERGARPVPDGNGLDAILDRLAGRVGPAVLQDRELRVLATAGRGERLVLDPAQCHVTRQVLRRVPTRPDPARLEVGLLPVRLVAGVVIGGDLLGYLTTEPTRPDDPGTGEEIERAAGAIGLEMAVEQRVSEILGRDEEDFFDDLLEGRPAHRVVTRGFKLGYDLRQEHTPLAFALDGDPGLLHDIVQGVAREVEKAAIVGRDEDAVLAFLPPAEPATVMALAQRALGQARQAGLIVAAGTGPACRTLGDYGRAAGKATWAARVRLMTGNTDVVSSFDDLGVCALLFQVDDQSELREFVERWVGALVAYDTRHHTQLTTTLRVLLDNRSLRASAQALFVHMSTLKYRIKRINEILEGDYQDPETVFNLQVALRLHQMLLGLHP